MYKDKFTFCSFWFNGNWQLWFIAFILTAYVLFPIIFKGVEGKHSGRNTAIMMILTGILMWTVYLENTQMYKNIEIALYRMLIFTAGVYIGRKVYECRKFGRGDYAAVAGGIALRFVCVAIHAASVYGEYPWANEIYDIVAKSERFTALWFGISLTYILASLFDKLKERFELRWLKKLGRLTLELYMSHVIMRSIFGEWGIPLYKWQNYVLCMAVSFVLAVITKKLAEAFSGRRKIKEECFKEGHEKKYCNLYKADV